LLWDFNDGTPTTNSSTSHIFNKAGTYRIALVVWDNVGRSSMAEKTIAMTDGAPTLQKLTGTPFGSPISYGSTHTYDKSIDGDITTFPDLDGNPPITGIDLGVGNARVISKIKYYPRADLPYRMVNGVFQGSNDGTNYVTLYTVTTTPSVDWHEVSITDTTAYRYLRYIGDYGNIAEMEFYSYSLQ